MRTMQSSLLCPRSLGRSAPRHFVFAYGASMLWLVLACSSSAPGSSQDGSPPGGASGASGGGGGLPGGSGGSAGASGIGGADASATGDVRPAGPFWCPGYRTGSSTTHEGWVDISAVVMKRGSGGMTSPIQTCEAGATDWSVTASGTERDGIDETTMSFKVSGKYRGPGIYTGSSSQGISVSFSHSDLDDILFASVPTSECEICINEDGLSGTVNCWDLEAPAGAALAVAYLPGGSFTCPGAQAKPDDAPTTTTNAVIASQYVVCHYLATLNCPGRTADQDCVHHSDKITVDGPCSTTWNQWEGCTGAERPSTFRCDSGDVLKTTTGVCDTELAALNACRAGTGGTGGSAGSPPASDLSKSAECDAYCAKLQSACGIACNRSFDCVVPVGFCSASTLAYLACAAQGNAIECGTNSYLVRNCMDDPSICP